MGAGRNSYGHDMATDAPSVQRVDVTFVGAAPVRSVERASLSDDERALLRSLAVFAGRVTLDDVEAVCAPPDESSPALLWRLGALVDKSLVIKEDDGDVAMYRLHECTREFASIESRALGEADDLEQRCVDHYLARATNGPAARYRLVGWLSWADREIDNVRAVLRVCVERGEFDRGLTVAVSFGWYWITRATTEGIRWLDELLGRTTATAPELSWAYFIRGFLAVLKADPAAARDPLSKAIDLSRTGAIGGLLPQALAMAAVAEDTAGDNSAASCYLEEAAAAAEGSGHRGAALAVLQACTLHGFFTGDIDSARRSAADGAQLAEAVGDVHGLEVMLLNLGTVALLHSDMDEAEPLLRDALRLAEQIDDRVTQSYLLDAFGCHAAAVGDPRRAAQLFGAAEAARSAAAARVMPFLEAIVQEAAATVIAQLGPSYQTSYELGRRLPRSAAIASALREPDTDGPGATPDQQEDAPVLAQREMDVARLVAEGLTNKEIGSRLYISERTVDAHVRNILTKFGFTSRAQIAAWTARTE